jgi:leader peptidase (prepilin peptidase) / N-methyltransferase
VTAVLVVGCSILGLVVGWLADPVITRLPLKQPVRGPAGPDEAPPPRGRRVAVAILCGALCGAVAAEYDDTWVLPAYLVVAIALVVLAVIDLEHFLLPNRIVYPLGFVSIALFGLAAIGDDNFNAYTRGLLAGVIAFVIFFVLHMVSPRGMGFGDVKLSFVLGLSLGWLGWGEVFVGLFLGFLYGALIGIVLIVTRIRARDQALPFGPFLAAGAMTGILVGTAIVDWYRGP